MKNSRYMIWLGVAAAAGTAIGLLAEPRNPAKGGLFGAVAGLAAGTVAAVVQERIDNSVPLYSSSSVLYDESDAA